MATENQTQEKKEKIIDLSKHIGSHSLGGNFENFVLGDIVKDGLEKIRHAVEQGKNSRDTSLKSGYTANNVFIDGRRGSGKTTVLLTIKEILENNYFKFIWKENSKDIGNIEFEVIDSVIDTSVNVSSITFYFLSWLKEKIEKEHESDFELHQQLYKVLQLFPKSLIDDNFGKLQRDIDGIEEIIDRSDLNFKQELFKLIDKYLEREKDKYIVLFIDDLDISFPVERIPQILNEIFMFLSHPNVIVIAAGDYSNLNKMLEVYVQKKTEKNNTNSNSIKTHVFNEVFYRNVAKSFLEKTFTTHIVRIYELSYEYIKQIGIKGYNKSNIDKQDEVIPINEFLEKKVPIIGLLSFDSVIFKILFDGLTTRELVLMLREVDAVKIEKDKLEETPIINLCFSHIYHKIKGFDLELSFDTRINTKLSDKEKSSEFDVIAKRIQEYLQNKEEGFFFEDDKHSLLTRTLEINRRTKDVALFWLWTVENMLFMDGFVKNIPRIILLDVFSQLLKKQEKESRWFEEEDFEYIQQERSYRYLNLESFINFWKNLNFETNELSKIYSSYEHYLNVESFLSVQLGFFLDDFLEKISIKKGENYNLHILKIIDYLLNFKNIGYYNKIIYLMSSTSSDEILEKTFNEYKLNLVIDNFKDKLIKEYLKKPLSIEERFSYFLLFYVNLVFKLFSNKENFVKFEKDIKLQNFIEKYKEIKKYIDRIEREVSDLEFRKEIPKDFNLESFLREIDWWIEDNYENAKPGTVKNHIRKLEKYLINFRQIILEIGDTIRGRRLFDKLMENISYLKKRDKKSVGGLLESLKMKMDLKRMLLDLKSYLRIYELEIKDYIDNIFLRKMRSAHKLNLWRKHFYIYFLFLIFVYYLDERKSDYIEKIEFEILQDLPVFELIFNKNKENTTQTQICSYLESLNQELNKYIDIKSIEESLINLKENIENLKKFFNCIKSNEN